MATDITRDKLQKSFLNRQFSVSELLKNINDPLT
jgi:hypothetical protein